MRKRRRKVLLSFLLKQLFFFSFKFSPVFSYKYVMYIFRPVTHSQINYILWRFPPYFNSNRLSFTEQYSSSNTGSTSPFCSNYFFGKEKIFMVIRVGLRNTKWDTLYRKSVYGECCCVAESVMDRKVMRRDVAF